MPCPTPGPAPPAAAAAGGEKRPAPLMKRIARAVSWVFGGKDTYTYGVALVGSLAMLTVIRVVTFTADPEDEVARFWLWLLLCAWFYILLDTACWHWICYCREHYEPQLQQPAEAGAEVQLPPPPPEIDMC